MGCFNKQPIYVKATKQMLEVCYKSTHNIDLFSSDFYNPAVQLLGSKHFQSHIHQILS